MPNLPAHIDFAHQAARNLGHLALEANTGHFLLGSTSPDIRVITRKGREEYHFAPLDFDEIGAGLEGLFGSHPELAPASSHDAPTQAFIAGYITHLIADEIWIVDMYRPYFGNPEVFEDEVSGKVLDRALQLELDRQAWGTVTSTRAQLEGASDGVDLGFISAETLADWRQWVLTSLDRGFSWDRLRFMARRIAAGDDAHPAHGVAEEFVQTMPQSLERLYQLVPRHRLADVKERTVEELVRVVGDYLQ